MLMTPQLRLFCNSPHPTDKRKHDNQNVISVSNFRKITLDYPSFLKKAQSSTSEYAVMARALRSYYEAKRLEITNNSPYYKFVHHEKVLRTFGKKVNERLDKIPIPEAIKNLEEGKRPKPP